MNKKYGIVVISVIISSLLLVQGYQALVIECLKHEIGVLRNQNDASRHDIQDIRAFLTSERDYVIRLIDLANDVNQLPHENKVKLTMDLPEPAPVNIRKAKQSLWQSIKDRLMVLVWGKPEIP